MRKTLTIAMFAMATFVASLAQQKNDKLLLQAQAIDAVYENNDFDKAIELVSLCIAQFEPDVKNYMILATAQYDKGNCHDALLSIEKGMAMVKRKDYATKAYLLKLKGDAFYALEEWNNAIENYNAAYQIEPDSKFNCLIARGWAYSQIGDFEKSNADFEEAKKLLPANIASYLGLCYNLKEQKKYDEAIDQYSKALVRLNNDEALLIGRAECYALQKKWVSAANDVVAALNLTANANVKTVYNHFDNIGFDVMASKLKSLVRKANNENDVLLQYTLLDLYNYFDKYEEALPCAKRINDVMYCSGTLSELAEMCEKTNRMPEALQYAQEAVQNDSSDVTAQNLYAQQLFYAGNIDKANKVFETTKNNNPTNLNCAISYARFLIETGDPSKAKAVLDAVIDRASSPANYVWHYYGRTLWALGLTDQANQVFSKCLRDKDMTQCFSLFFMGRQNEALASADSILANSPFHEYISNLYNGACLFSLANDTTRALDLLSKSFENGYIDEGLVKTDLDLANLRNTHGYAELAKKYFKAHDDYANSQIMVVELPVFTEGGNTNMLKCEVNGLPLKVAFHTQTSSVTISSVEANFLLKNEYIQASDVHGRNPVDFYGNLRTGAQIMIRNLSFGSLKLENVMATVAQQKAPIMLGPSAMAPLGKCELDGAAHILRIETKKK